MNDLLNLSGNYVLDPAHTEIGFVARHAMVTRVRGSFKEFEGTASTDANLANAAISLTAQVADMFRDLLAVEGDLDHSALYKVLDRRSPPRG